MLTVLGIVLAVLAVFALYMLAATASIGTERMKTSQYFLSSLEYNEEASVKLNLLMDKYEAQLLTVKVTKDTLVFTDKETGAKAGEIWIANKYFSYGQLYRYGASNNNNWQNYKPDLKTFKRIIKLEKQLDPNEGKSEPTAKKSDEKDDLVVLK
ncbi:hypothetical protein DQT32_03780 [Salmonella enterica subsp. enterica serovar Braenderup]|nr:hypothetical protein [Salmonella enterica subsp. enterica serovar Braenderup]